MTRWLRHAFNPRHPLLRWPLKATVLLGVVLLVLYPRPGLLLRNIDHWSRLDTLADPASPALDPLDENVRALLNGDPVGADPAIVLQTVQHVVVQELPYEWDWITWGVVDYIPTIEEALDAGREDCDGRAIVAAGLLRRYGFDARVMSDLSHVWVWTPQGSAMGHRETVSGATLVHSTPQGTRLDWLAVFSIGGILVDWPLNLAYGIQVFPIARELVLLITLWLLLLSRSTTRPRHDWLGLAFLLVALLGFRWAGSAGTGEGNEMWAIVAWASLACVTVAAGLMRWSPAQDNPPQAR